jgi:NAD(P)-dependent dehydrogenase (short-subunit alcohol dehydrogenase family)
MMRTLALEWGRVGIRSNSIAPGFIAETEGTKRVAHSGAVAAIVKATPLSRLGSVDDIGQAAVFLSIAAGVLHYGYDVGCGWRPLSQWFSPGECVPDDTLEASPHRPARVA